MHPQTLVKIHERPEAPQHTHPPSARELPIALGWIPAQRTYRASVPTDPAVRLASYTAFVRRALDHAKTQRGWSVEDVAAAAGISANTIYIWRSGAQWKQFPKGESVEAFCDALGIKPEVAFGLLWPGRDDRPTEPIPLGPDDDLIILARRLSDPNVSPQEKFLIRETIRGLAARSTESADASTDAPKRRDAS